MSAVAGQLVRPLPWRALAFALVLALLTLLVPGGSPGDWSGFPTAFADSRCWDPRPTERGFTRKLNAARVNAGKGRLSLDPEASKAARRHTTEMVNRRLLHHTPNSTLARRVTRWSTLGENVGVGGTVASLHAAFMNSPSHRSNILYSSFRHVGVGSLRRGGRLWVTVIFEAATDPGTTLRMPRC